MDFDKNAPGCTVCGARRTCLFVSVGKQDYWRCDRCRATVLDPSHYLSTQEESERYQKHENSSDDQGYRRFLGRLAAPLLKKLTTGQVGLDYGCGPGPVLSQILQDAGQTVRLYDPLFFPDQTLLDLSYDFITCTEVIEHFFRPAEQFANLNKMLRPGGWLAVMTGFLTDDDHFSSWHYRNDPTHVVFYKETTLQYIAQSFGWSCEIPVKDVALMQKPLNR